MNNANYKVVSLSRGLPSCTGLALILCISVCANRVHAQEKADEGPASDDVAVPIETINQNDRDTIADRAVQNRRKSSRGATAQGDEIVVTGTRIRGARFSVGSPVITIGKEEIEQSGFSTTTQIIQSLPQNFGGGASEDTTRGLEAGANRTFASGVNLRGLGNVATLVLLNGRRMLGASINGDIPDISMIPAAAIERIEVLPDGASAVYGSDAVAGVVNFILRRKYSGAETRLRYGTVTDGHLDEYQIGQTLGLEWNTGGLMITGEYSHRDHLRATDREFSKDSDLRPLGGTDWRLIGSVPGNIIDPFTREPLYAIPPNQNGRNLALSDLLPGSQTNRFNDRLYADLLPRQRRYSTFTTVNNDINESVNGYVEGFFSQRNFKTRYTGTMTIVSVPIDNPFYIDVFGDGRPISVAYDFFKDVGQLYSSGSQKAYEGVLGLNYDVTTNWLLSGRLAYAGNIGITRTNHAMDPWRLAAALADTSPDTALNVFGEGNSNNPETIAQIFSLLSRQNTKLTATAGTLLLDGVLATLPAGEAKIAIGAEARGERLRWRNKTGEEFDLQKYKRRVLAIYGEVLLPLVGQTNSVGGIQRLEVSMALRAEQYADDQIYPQRISKPSAETVNPKFGVRWELSESLSVYGTYGTAFRAPSLTQLLSEKLVYPSFLEDPVSPTGQSYVLLIGGTAPNLKNEKATTWTVGVSLTPIIIPNLRLHLSYYNIRFRDRIVGADNPREMLISEHFYPGLLIRTPSPADIAAACADATQNFAVMECMTPSSVDAIADIRTANRAVYRTDGVDMNIEYIFDTGRYGSVHLSANANYVFSLKQSPTSSAPAKSILNKFGNPVDFRARGALGWKPHSNISINIFANYTNNYKNNLSLPYRNIHSNFTMDFSMSWQTGRDASINWLRNVSFTLSALNIFDDDPPFVDVKGGYDPDNADPLGRFLSLTIKKAL